MERYVQEIGEDTISLRRIFLPYHRYFEGEQGWQFSLPPSDEVEGQYPMTIVLLSETGDWYLQEKPELTAPSQGALQPVWAWVPFHLQGHTEYACLRPPERKPGSYPLEKMMESGAEKMLCPDKGNASFDMPETIRAEREDGEYMITLGMTKIAQVLVKNEEIRVIKPQKAAVTLGLWTSHIFRMAYVFSDDMRKLSF